MRERDERYLSCGGGQQRPDSRQRAEADSSKVDKSAGVSVSAGQDYKPVTQRGCDAADPANLGTCHVSFTLHVHP